MYPLPFSAPFYILSSFNRDTLSRLRISCGSDTRGRRVGALALIHLASPEEVINHPVRRILLSSVSQYLTLINQGTAIRMSWTFTTFNDWHCIAPVRTTRCSEIDSRARVITGKIFAYINLIRIQMWIFRLIMWILPGTVGNTWCYYRLLMTITLSRDFSRHIYER